MGRARRLVRRPGRQRRRGRADRAGRGIAQRSFLILHGWQASGPKHWQTWLARELEAAAEDVRYPLLPQPMTPRLDEWLGALRPLLAAMPGERVVLCHSLGCILWLQHARDASPEDRADRVLLVAPPSPRAKLPGVVGFFPLAVTPEEVAAAAGETRLVCSLDDPYCPECGDSVYGRPLGIETDVIEAAAHVNVDAGYGPWPAVRAWALMGTVPLA